MTNLNSTAMNDVSDLKVIVEGCDPQGNGQFSDEKESSLKYSETDATLFGIVDTGDDEHVLAVLYPGDTKQPQGNHVDEATSIPVRFDVEASLIAKVDLPNSESAANYRRSYPFEKPIGETSSSMDYPIESESPALSALPQQQMMPTEDDVGGSGISPPLDTGIYGTTNSSTMSTGTPLPKGKLTGNLRRGKWTVEEEAFVARVIQDFNSGYLDAPAGTTLRTYLSEKLKCDPMRITKKFTGEACIGKRVFHPAVRSPVNAGTIDKAQAELDALERRWRRRVEMQQRESVKKAAASVAVAAVSGSRTLHGFSSMPIEIPGSSEVSIEVHGNQIAKTASWLDRAKSLLNEPSGRSSSVEEQSQELENQMEEVQRLIHEGPIIQQTSHELPQILDTHHYDATGGLGTVVVVTAGAGTTDDEPADKRLRTAEDAEALVGFLRSVRASAAHGSVV